MRVIISGGGSGGHIFPAIAIAHALKNNDPQTEILFVGAKGKIEMEKVPKAGFEIVGLDISGFHRKNMMRNISFPLKLVKSLFAARKVLKEFKPDVVVGVGGFASGPVMYMASKLGIDSLIQEQNSYPGITNKLLAGKAERICVAYPGMEKYFDAEKIVFTGNPVRRDIYENNINTEDAKAFFGLDGKNRTVLIFGGSLGARSINNAILNRIDIIRNHADVNILWQAGKLYYEEFSQSEAAALPNVTLLPFIDKMDMAYAAADVIVCRAGALTISELALVAKPSILVPSPNVAEDHQTKNAQALVDVGASEIIRDAEAAGKLVPAMMNLLNDEERKKVLKEGMEKLARPNASSQIVGEIIRIVNAKS